MTISTLKTKRLTLRPFNPNDIDPLHHIVNQPDVFRYFPNPDPPPDKEKVERIIKRQLSHWAEHGYGWWAVEHQEKPGLIGWQGLQYLPETDEVEVGYLLAKPYWGQGLGTEGAKASLSYGFDTLGITQIIGLTHPDNIASQRVLEKAGLKFSNKAHYFGIDVYRYVIDAMSKVPQAGGACAFASK